MRNQLLVALSIAAFGVAGAAAQSAQPATGQQTTGSNANQNVTITGCVEAGPNNAFTLVAAPSAADASAPTGTTATTPAGSKVAKTVTYTLTGAKAEDLKPHVGHTVQVTGSESAPQVTAGTTDRSTGTASTQGTSGSSGTAASGGGTPTVETTAQTQIVVRQLSVSSVKMVSSSCSLVK